MLPNLDALQKNVALMKDLGFVKTSVDVKNIPTSASLKRLRSA
jgi:hypothetical protein